MEKLKVLLVEDSEEFQIIYKVGLTDTVFDKRFASDGVKALEIYNSWRPDIIVLDIMVPGMSGYHVLETIRAQKGDKKTAVIMASSLSGTEAVVEFVKLGIQGYLVKPFTHREVGGKILEYYGKTSPARAEVAKAAFEACCRRSLRA